MLWYVLGHIGYQKNTYNLRDTLLARDSYKDEAIVCTFLVLTGGLVVSAALKPYYKRWRSVSGNRVDKWLMWDADA